MNHATRAHDRNSSPRTGGSARSRGGRFNSPAQGRSGASNRSGNGRRPAALQREFALPVTVTPALPAAATFAELSMPPALLKVLSGLGVNEPFPIQAATLPNSLAGRDVLGRGRTGSGKTLAFGLALLVRTSGQRAQSRRPLALILVPTRELAQQVTDALTPYAQALKLRLATVVGGMSISRQAHALRNGAEVVIATPGRLRDLIERGDCSLDQVGITVLDEADQMADMGFMPQITHLLDQV
ncbi:DEAD/DEAH box helicase, partial [Nonomuraea sp. NPDC051191]